MARVPRNKGSYAQRKSGSGWQVKYPLGWNESIGKYDEYREDVPTEAEAISLIKAINDFVYHGGRVSEIAEWRSSAKKGIETNSLTVSEFASEYLEMKGKGKGVQPRTVQSDRTCFNRAEPYIGSLPLKSVTPRDLDSMYASMRSDGDDNLAGRAYSGTTVQKTHAFLKMLFGKAVDYGYIDRNPCAKTDAPKRDTKEKAALMADQAKKLVAAIREEPLAAKPVGILISLFCGLRLSEMLALTWDDYSNGSISVTKSLAQDKQGYKPTKTGDTRDVPCPPPLISILEEWRGLQRIWFESHGLGWGGESPIVNSRVGNHVLQRTYIRWFDVARSRYGLPGGFTFHGLRHTYVTLLNRDCHVDERTTRSMSGHKSSQAFQIYTHTAPEWQRRAAGELGMLLTPDPDAELCMNCRFWAASPANATRGVCWANEGSSMPVTSSAAKCATGDFNAATAR